MNDVVADVFNTWMVAIQRLSSCEVH